MSHLNTIDIIRAWKDPEYRLSLSEAERAQLPEHPAGIIELGEAELGHAVGGFLGSDTPDFDSAGVLGASGSHHDPKTCCSAATNPNCKRPPPPPDGGAPDGGLGAWW